MELLSYRVKLNVSGFFNYINNLTILIILFSLFNLSVCIYEDQIGKFDWRQTYVGKIKFAQFDTLNTAKKIIVATEENVLAALNLKTGQIFWRHVFEAGDDGEIQMLHVAEKVVTVTGSNPYLVRGWDSTTGILVWEWSLTLQNAVRAPHARWWVQRDTLISLLPVTGSHLEVTTYSLLSGQNRGATSKLPAAWLNRNCILSPPYFTCITGDYGSQLLLSLDVTSNAVQLITKPLSEFLDSSTEQIRFRVLSNNMALNAPGFAINKKVIFIENNQFLVSKAALEDDSVTTELVRNPDGLMLLQMVVDDSGAQVSARDAYTGVGVGEIGGPLAGWSAPDARLLAGACTRTPRDSLACRLLASAGDASLHLIQPPAKVVWNREEALTRIVSAEMLDLPVSDLDAAIETEFNHKEGDVLGALIRRLRTQLQQLTQSVSLADAATDASPLVRDTFGLHKLILVVTDVGKIFGLDNLTGNILWSRYVPTLSPSQGRASIFVRRTARHAPLDAYVTVLGKHRSTGNGLLVSLNPITGALMGEGIMELDYEVQQAVLTAKADSEHIRGLALLASDNSLQVLPASAASLLQNMFLYVANRETAVVQGYSLRYDGKSPTAERIWTVSLDGDAKECSIVQMAAKNPLERVHSQGKVMGDRSVLYKYTNPNLVAFATHCTDPVHKDVLNIYLLDVVSGGVVLAQSHRRAKPPVHFVHSENWLVYSFFNDKHRRTEIVTVELYEGATRALPPGAAFSSLAAAPVPLVARQAYVLPASLSTMGETITERGITPKDVIMVLSSGAVVEVSWAWLDARRPSSAAAATEGLPPYAPELPLPPDARLNYNLTVERPRAVIAAPATLESTSLVLVYGLDLFYTRVAPSRTFDLLKEDFDYFLIMIVLGALIAASYSTKYFAARKMLKQAWK